MRAAVNHRATEQLTLGRAGTTARAGAWLALWLLSLGTFATGAAVEGGPARPALVRIGIAPGTWSGVNHNDAKAGITAWAKTILRQHEIAVDVETQVFDTPEAMRQSLKNGRVDAVSVLADQFLALEPELQPQEIFLGTKNHSFAEHYSLLVRREAGLEEVAGLAGKKVLLQANAHAGLALYWLDLLLARHALGPATKVLQSLTRIESPTKAILQVFFHQAEACLVTSNVFAVACELNPQLRKQLRMLAVSPAVVPSLFFFRPGYSSSARDLLEPAILALHESPAGQQVLTVFQSDGMVKRPRACLEGTRQFLAEYARGKALQTTNRVTKPPDQRKNER